MRFSIFQRLLGIKRHPRCNIHIIGIPLVRSGLFPDFIVLHSVREFVTSPYFNLTRRLDNNVASGRNRRVPFAILTCEKPEGVAGAHWDALRELLKNPGIEVLLSGFAKLYGVDHRPADCHVEVAQVDDGDVDAWLRFASEIQHMSGRLHLYPLQVPAKHPNSVDDAQHTAEHGKNGNDPIHSVIQGEKRLIVKPASSCE